MGERILLDDSLSKGGVPLRVIAITGGIGSGKSTLTGLWRTYGAQVVDADAISRALTAAGGEALPAIREAFGDGVFRPDGTLDRPTLAQRVFGQDASARMTLNAIMHPMIIRRSIAALDALRAQDTAVAVLDAPLLYETGMDALADAVVCVSAPQAVRIRRIQRRDQLTYAQALQRIQSQTPSAALESRADYVLMTDAPMPATQRKARELWARILADGPRRSAARSPVTPPAQPIPDAGRP